MTKILADGSYAWSYTVGALDVADSAGGIAISPTGEIVVAGGFAVTVDFDPGPGVDEFSPSGVRSSTSASQAISLPGRLKTSNKGSAKLRYRK